METQNSTELIASIIKSACEAFYAPYTYTQDDWTKGDVIQYRDQFVILDQELREVAETVEGMAKLAFRAQHTFKNLIRAIAGREIVMTPTITRITSENCATVFHCKAQCRK